MSAVDEGAEARRLADEDGLSQRQIAVRLDISRYKVGRLLADQPRPVADQVAEPADQVAEPVADRTAGREPTGSLLVIDVDRHPGLAEDLDLLQRTGAATAEDVVNFAVDRLARAYRQALARGVVRDGQAFDVAAMWLTPAPAAARPSP